jgi:hypothetical protein
MILFYRRKKDSVSSAKYYREFDTFEELIRWCNAIKNECRYYRFSHKNISKDKFLKNEKLSNTLMRS